MKKNKLTLSMLLALLIYCSSIFSSVAYSNFLLDDSKESIAFFSQTAKELYTPIQKGTVEGIENFQTLITPCLKTISIINENLFYNKKLNSNKMFCYAMKQKNIFKDYYVAKIFHNFY